MPLFGTGLSRPLAGAALDMVRDLNRTKLPVIAVDIPSGLDGSNGYPPEGRRCRAGGYHRYVSPPQGRIVSGRRG